MRHFTCGMLHQKTVVMQDMSYEIHNLDTSHTDASVQQNASQNINLQNQDSGTLDIT